MRKLRHILFQLFFAVFIWALITTDTLNFSRFIEVILGLWMIKTIWSIFYSRKYLNGKIFNQIRFSISNDSYYKGNLYVFGIILIIGGVSAFLFFKDYSIYFFMLILNGILLIISSKYFIPSGIIKIKDDEISLFADNQKKTIEIEKVHHIELRSNDIVLSDENQKIFTLNYLKLKESDFRRISDFLDQNLNKKIEVKTNNISEL